MGARHIVRHFAATAMKKKVDGRIRTLVENCVKLRRRAMFVVIGDKGHDQVVNLHYLLSKTLETTRPSVLWCYKTNLYLSSHKAKRQKQIQKLTNRGLLESSKDDPFTVFVACTKIRYCYYHETHKILGNTFGMCVLQDFEALTPNLLAHTIETVMGGGLIVLLLSNLQSLTQLYQLTMDVHARFKTESFSHVTGHFNERLVLSLASNPSCILMDDELNILPISSHVKSIAPVETQEDGSLVTDPSRAFQEELTHLIDHHKNTQVTHLTLGAEGKVDQAKAVVAFMEVASEKTLRSTVALTAARGRGKSAAMGLAVAGAIALGYSNIFVTAPSPENLKTLFEFVCKGLDALDYNEHTDYDLVASTNPAFNKAIVRVNVFRHHRQTVQYILPQHHHQLSQAELVVIDEAAAIPLPMVRAMLGPYLVFLCSTVNGYEGTGRSLSLKLIKQIRDQSHRTKKKTSQGLGRTLKELTLEHPIRYAPGDEMEHWLNELLCLNCADHVPPIPKTLPHPDQCDVYYVERSTLFSFHKQSEFFLQQMMSLYVSSHYKNTPNDLVLISDAPAHRLFVLLGPIDPSINVMPDVLCVVQVNLEGGISRRSVLSTLGRGASPNGDLIPWTVGQQFQDNDFPGLSGARIVRIAVHPDLGRAGYGTRALKMLEKYYEGSLYDIDQAEDIQMEVEGGSPSRGAAEGKGLLEERVEPRQGLPPLFINLSDRRPEGLDYLGTSFGLTLELYNFWHKSGYLPVYVRQTRSEVTGEHTVIMIKPLKKENKAESTQWLQPFVNDFRRRFSTLLGTLFSNPALVDTMRLGAAFKEMDPVLALTILNPKLSFTDAEIEKTMTGGIQVVRNDGDLLDVYDLKRLQSYANNLIDHHLILDLVPCLARTYFAAKIPVSLSYGQAAILLCLGLQMRDVSCIEKAIDLPQNQVLALFSKTVSPIRKMHAMLKKTTPAVPEQLRRMPIPSTQQTQNITPSIADARGEMPIRELERFKVSEDVTMAEGEAPVEGTVVSVKRKSESPAEVRERDAKSKKKSKKLNKSRRERD